MGPNALGMQARCLNPDCDKEPWTLRKHPSEYSGGGPSCPDCGSTRVEVAGQETQTPATAQQESEVMPEQFESEGEIAATAAMGSSKAAYAVFGDNEDEQEMELLSEGLGDIKDSFMGWVRRDRSKKRTAEEVELGEPEQVYPQCECGRVFKRIGPEQTSVRCNNCGREYPIEGRA